MCNSVQERVRQSPLMELEGECIVCAHCGELMRHTLCRDRYVDGEFVDCHKWLCETEGCMVEHQFGGPVEDGSAVSSRFECVESE